MASYIGTNPSDAPDASNTSILRVTVPGVAATAEFLLTVVPNADDWGG
jgi:hypothetical protein